MHRLAPLPGLVLFAFAAAACSEPPDDTPLGREIAAIMARPAQDVPKVKVQHVLVGFVGAKRGSETKHTYAEARALAADLLARARAGEDFAALMKKYSNDDGPGTYTLTPGNPEGYADNFAAIAYRLAVGEIGVAAHHVTRSPFGWHVIKRIE